MRIWVKNRKIGTMRSIFAIPQVATTVIQYCRIRDLGRLWKNWDINIQTIVKEKKSPVKIDYFTRNFSKDKSLL